MQENKNFDLQQRNQVMEVLIEEYKSVIKIDLKNGDVMIIKSNDRRYDEDVCMSWDEYQERLTHMVYDEDFYLFKEKTLLKLREFYEGTSSIFPFEVRTKSNERVYDWNIISAKPIRGNRKELLITIKLANEDHMLKTILDQYLYNNLDYYVVIDAIHNTYKMFSGNSKTPIPPSVGYDYEAEVIRYNKQFVVPEDYEELTNHMKIKNMVAQLEEKDVYEFSGGFFDTHGNYHRSRLQISYYDKSMGLIVMTRTDITQIYLEEGEKEKRLANALRAAQQDTMTSLYNNKASAKLISDALRQRYRAQAVLFFVDIDNFKLVNDTFGHQLGDQVICFLSDKLKAVAGKDGIAGRLGGDEFILYMPVNESMEEIKGYAKEICDSFQTCSILAGSDLPVSCSVGISVYPTDGSDYEDLLYKCDQAVYNAKRHGKNQFSFYSDIAS